MWTRWWPVERHEPFGALGYFYRDFRQLEDADVIAFLKEFPPGGVGGPAPWRDLC